jgi:hypothetical protein
MPIADEQTLHSMRPSYHSACTSSGAYISNFMCGLIASLQERNMAHPDGSPEASRMTASARRKLGSLGTSLDTLFRWLDSPDAATL